MVCVVTLIGQSKAAMVEWWQLDLPGSEIQGCYVFCMKRLFSCHCAEYHNAGFIIIIIIMFLFFLPFQRCPLNMFINTGSREH